jgi:hypothetical protein
VATRRARTRVRRYCAANRLNRLATLTYRGEGCHERQRLSGDVGGFFRRLRQGIGGAAFPYLWTGEWHKRGHGLHVHFAVGRFVPRTKIEDAWPHGFVHIKLLGDPAAGGRRILRWEPTHPGLIADFDNGDYFTAPSPHPHRTTNLENRLLAADRSSTPC